MISAVIASVISASWGTITSILCQSFVSGDFTTFLEPVEPKVLLYFYMFKISVENNEPIKNIDFIAV